MFGEKVVAGLFLLVEVKTYLSLSKSEPKLGFYVIFSKKINFFYVILTFNGVQNAKQYNILS